MKTEQYHFKIGLFVIGATVLLVAGIVLLGAGHLFQKRILIESYFDESVQGLETGSPVKFQGLTIGEVSSIDTVGFLYSAEQSDLEQAASGRYVVVTMSITSYEAMGLSAETHTEEFQRAVDNGLRFRLASIGLTGTKFVEASFFDPLRAPPLEISWQPRFPYVPSAPDAINHIIDNVEDLMDRFAGTDFEGLLIDLDSTIVSTREAVEGQHLARQRGVTWRRSSPAHASSRRNWKLTCRRCSSGSTRPVSRWNRAWRTSTPTWVTPAINPRSRTVRRSWRTCAPPPRSCRRRSSNCAPPCRMCSACSVTTTTP